MMYFFRTSPHLKTVSTFPKKIKICPPKLQTIKPLQAAGCWLRQMKRFRKIRKKLFRISIYRTLMTRICKTPVPLRLITMILWRILTQWIQKNPETEPHRAESILTGFTIKRRWKETRITMIMMKLRKKQKRRLLSA